MKLWASVPRPRLTAHKLRDDVIVPGCWARRRDRKGKLLTGALSTGQGQLQGLGFGSGSGRHLLPVLGHELGDDVFGAPGLGLRQPDDGHRVQGRHHVDGAVVDQRRPILLDLAVF